MILWLLKALEDHIPSVRNGTLIVELSDGDSTEIRTERSLRQTLHKADFHITTWKVRFVGSRPCLIECGVRWMRKGHHQPSTPEVIEQLAAAPDVKRLTWRS